MTPTPRPNVLGRHAIICGSSMAGLLAAGLLARHFERVTLVERDRLEDSASPRKGVPQGAQTHILLRRGLDITNGLFPGLREDLEAAGSQVLDMSADHEWFVSGFWRRRIQSGIYMYSQTRSLFEWRVRTKLLALPNVRVLDEQEVSSFLMSADGARVTGVKVRAPGGGEEAQLEGDLVVDASGRGSRTPQWLEALGYPRVEETHIKIDLGYASRLYRRPAGFDPGWKGFMLAGQLPRLPRGGSILPVEEDRWIVTLAGYLRDYPPTDDAGFLAYSRTLAQPHLYEVLRNAEPLAPAISYRFSHSQWRHYERLPRLPEGLLVMGDAFCSFNPVYAQGITISALQVEALGQCLRAGLTGLSSRYFKRAGDLFKMPWTMATSEDFRLPEVEGKRPVGLGAMYWYGDRFQRLTASDEEAVRTFMEIVHMLKPPSAMFSPRFVLKTLIALPSDAEMARGPEPLAIPKVC